MQIYSLSKFSSFYFISTQVYSHNVLHFYCSLPNLNFDHKVGYNFAKIETFFLFHNKLHCFHNG